MAIKIFEPKMIDTTLLVQLSRGSYDSQDFKKMEFDILFGLDWYLNDPTPMNFATHYLCLLPLQEMNILIRHEIIYEHTIYQLELALVDYEMMLSNPSSIALAALSNSLNYLYTAHGAQYDGLRLIRLLEKVSKQSINLSSVCKLSFGLERLLDTNKPAVRRRLCPTTISQSSKQNYSRTSRILSEEEASPNCVLH
jgi:hypothetical protein